MMVEAAMNIHRT